MNILIRDKMVFECDDLLKTIEMVDEIFENFYIPHCHSIANCKKCQYKVNADFLNFLDLNDDEICNPLCEEYFFYLKGAEIPYEKTSQEIKEIFLKHVKDFTDRVCDCEMDKKCPMGDYCSTCCNTSCMSAYTYLCGTVDKKNIFCK